GKTQLRFRIIPNIDNPRQRLRLYRYLLRLTTPKSDGCAIECASGDERLSVHAATAARVQRAAGEARSSDGRGGFSAGEAGDAGNFHGDGLQLPGRAGEVRFDPARSPRPRGDALLS